MMPFTSVYSTLSTNFVCYFLLFVFSTARFVTSTFDQQSRDLNILRTIFEQFNSDVFNHSYPDVNQFYPEYDFIVIGSGSGGSVMASRLSEIYDWTVLLLELGQEESFLTDVPLTTGIAETTAYNWGYKADPTPNTCKAAPGSVCNWPKGRALGGSSVINYMLYNRGNKRDYDEWAALGNYGWSFDEVLPYFKKSENIDVPDLMDSPYHGHGGPLNIERSPWVSKLFKPFVAAVKELGYKHNDPDGEYQLGVSRVIATMQKGRRCSAARAFLKPAINRPNLHISKHSWVTKVLIDPLQKKAVGVEFLKNKKRFVVRIKKEVILSAGTIGSAQLLMLSGVGPKDHLESLGIPVIQDLAVGYNLQDHPSLSGLVFPVNQPITVREQDVQAPAVVFDYLINNGGQLTLPGGSEGLAFLKTNISFQASDYPDIELVLGPGSLAGDASGTLRHVVGISDEYYNKVWGPISGKHAFSIVPVLMRPKSRGRVMLRSTNPFHWPHLQPNYYQHPDDMRVMVEGAKLAVRVGESKSFKKFGSRLYSKPIAGCVHLPFRSDKYFECTVNQVGTSLQHQVGTCKMGPATDPTAIVSPELQVHGISNLRVVDASIMPLLPAAHTNAAVFMIGEKGADLVKQFWDNQFK